MNQIDVRAEARALLGCFYFHEGNSNAQKVALYAAILLWFLMGLGLALDLVILDSTPKVGLWGTLTGVMAFLLGRTQGKELILQRIAREK